MTYSVALYLRVSTQEQSCDMQLRELKGFAEARGWTIAEVYEDKLTGTNSNRPMLRKMLLDAKEKKFQAIVCWKLDRLFRSLKDLILTLNDLSEGDIDFVSMKDNIDLTTNTGRLMMHLMGAFAEFEASLIRSRVIAGLQNAKANGTHLGRPVKVGSNQILALRLKGHSLSEIAKCLNLSKSTVSKTLKRLRSQGVVCEG